MLRQVHAGLAAAWVAAIIVQVFLAGTSIPQLGGTSANFATHVDFGYTMGILALLLVLAAAAARLGRRRILQAAGLLALYVVQTILPNLDPGLPLVAALHPVNAMVMFALSVWYLRAAWRERSGAAVLS